MMLYLLLLLAAVYLCACAALSLLSLWDEAREASTARYYRELNK